MRFQGPAKRTSGFIWFWALERPAAACVFRGLQNAHQGGPSEARVCVFSRLINAPIRVHFYSFYSLYFLAQYVYGWAFRHTASACVLRGPRNAWSVRLLRNCRLLSFSFRVGHVPAATAAASCPSRSRSAARAACSGSLAMMHQANASRLQLRAKRCNLNIPFRTCGLRTHDFSTYESYVRTSMPMPLSTYSSTLQKANPRGALKILLEPETAKETKPVSWALGAGGRGREPMVWCV